MLEYTPRYLRGSRRSNSPMRSYKSRKKAETSRSSGEIVVHAPDRSPDQWIVMDDSDKQRPEWAKELQEAGTCYCKRCEIFFQLKGALYDYGHASDLPSCLECGRGLFMLTGNWYPLLPVEYGLKS